MFSYSADPQSAIIKTLVKKKTDSFRFVLFEYIPFCVLFDSK